MTSFEISPSNAHRERKRRRIRDAAARVFAEKGFERTGIRDIARSAGISAAAIYYYFEDKEDLLFQILEETMSTGLKLIRDIETTDLSLRDQLTDILKVHTVNAIDFHKMKLLVHEQNGLLPHHRDVLKEKQKEYLAELTRIFQALKQNGEMKDLEPTVCAFAFFGMVSWAYRWFDPRGQLSTADLADTFARIFTTGIFTSSC